MFLEYSGWSLLYFFHLEVYSCLQCTSLIFNLVHQNFTVTQCIWKRQDVCCEN